MDNREALIERALGIGAPGDSRKVAVLFDVDGTLYRQPPVRGRMLALFARTALMRPVTVLEMRMIQHYRRAQEWLRRRLPEGAFTFETQLERASRTSGCGEDAIARAATRWMEQRPLEYVHRYRRRDVIAAIRVLNTAGIPMGVYSDYPAAKKLQALGLADVFRCVVASGDAAVQSLKPHGRGFLVAATILRARAADVIYVGDRADVDGEGAERAGMQYLDVMDLCAVSATCPSGGNES